MTRWLPSAAMSHEPSAMRRLLYTSGRRSALRVVDANHDGRHGAAVGRAAVRVFDVHVGVPDQPERRCQRARRIRERREDHIALDDLMMMLAKHGGAVHVVVD